MTTALYDRQAVVAQLNDLVDRQRRELDGLKALLKFRTAERDALAHTAERIAKHPDGRNILEDLAQEDYDPVGDPDLEDRNERRRRP